MSEIGYGVVGCGRIGRRHCQVIEQMPGTRVAAVSDPDAAKREHVQQQAPEARGYGQIGEILTDPRVDVVVICSPTHLHAQMTKEACEAGKHVYCEKAMAATPGQCRSMIEAADEAGVKLAIGQSTRFQPGPMMARRLVENGAIGEPFAVSASFCGIAEPQARGATDSWRYHAGSAGSGHVINFGCHYIDTARFVLGQDPVSVSALVHNLFSGELISEDQFLTQSECSQGGLIRVDLFSNFSGTKAMGRGYRVMGTKGVIEFPAWGTAVQLTQEDGESVNTPVDDDLAVHDGFQRLHRLFRDAVVRGGAIPLDGTTAALNLEWGLAAYISSKERHVVDLPLAPDKADFSGPVVARTIPTTRVA